MTPLPATDPALSQIQAPAANVTIGLHLASPLHAWARLYGVHEELCFFAHCLRVTFGIQSDQFGGALDGLAQCAPTIRRWAARGKATFGLEVLADHWRLTKQSLGNLPERVTTRDPLLDYRATAESQYLHLLLHSRLLDGPQALAQTTLRSYALLRALELAEKGVLAEGYLRRLCTNLRIATYEPKPDWGPVLSALVVKDQTFEMTSADLQAEISAVQGRMPSGALLQPKHLSFLASMRSLGAGMWSDETAAAQPGSAKIWVPVPRRRLAEPGGAELSADADLEAPLRLSVPLDHDLDVELVEVNPLASPRLQELQARSIHLASAMDASLVRWRWNTPSPPELQALDGGILAMLDAPASQPVQALLAAMAWIALTTGRTLDEVGRMAVDLGSRQFSHWKIDLHAGTLLQTPPRRLAHWLPSRDVDSLIHPRVDNIEWEMPDALLKVLRPAAAAAGRPRYMQDIWRSASSLSVNRAFLDWMQGAPATARLRPGMLAGALKQAVFERTGDGLLSRLLGCRDRDGLPAAAAYGTYLSSTVTKAIPWATARSQEANVAGSLLAPLTDDLLIEGFRRAHAELKRVQAAGDWIEFHNLSVLYWDAALRAATGVRPNSNLWTDRNSIDWTHAFAFIDEKASPLVRNGRLVPIPVQLLAAFKRDFVNLQLPFALKKLRETEHDYNPNLAGNLLFLIHVDQLPLATCAPVTQSDRKRLGVEGPFPLNVFRHRLRTGLQRQGADPEVIDAVLGHSDGSSPTHGVYSMRRWSRDMKDLRPAMSTLLERLSIPEPPTPSHACIDLTIEHPFSRGRHAGEAPGRLKAARQAIADATSTISSFLIEKVPLDSALGSKLSQDQMLRGLVRLTDTQVEELEVLLTRTDKGMPSTTGPLRHAYLVKLARKAWDVLERPVRLRRRFRPTEPEQSAFTLDAPGALDRLARLRNVLDDLFDDRPHLSQVSASDALIIATMDLIANSRIAAGRILSAISESRLSYRVERLGEAHYLEWSPDASLRERPDAPIQRFRITPRAAGLLEQLQGQTRRVDIDSHAAGVIRAIAAALDAPLPATFAAVRDWAASVVAQCNAIELPGAVAGYLNGRLMTAALSQPDFVRFRRQVFVRPAHSAMLGEAAAAPPAALAQTGTSARVDEEDSTVAARELLSEVRRKLTELQDPKASRHRSQALHALRGLINTRHEVSTTIRLLCLWAIDRLEREDQERPKHEKPAEPEKSPRPSGSSKPTQHRRRTIKTTSGKRYLSTLTLLFLDLTSNVDILALDAEELIDFYQALLSEAKVQNQNYLYRRLRDFHRFAMRYGATEVDWSELVPVDAPDLGAPGFIDEATYQKILGALEATAPPPGVLPWQLQVFAILCYRFGLRGGEVLHLRAGDWNELPDGLRVLLVRPRRFHPLKSRAAQRQIPLVFPLSPTEESALQELKTHHELAAMGTNIPPLLGAADDPQHAIADAVVRQHMNRIIQAVTGQASLSLHDKRHSLACRLWQALEQAPMPAGATDNALNADDVSRLREALLGPNPPLNTRRSAWVLANLLGHASPATTMRSYVHLVAEAAEVAVGPRLEAVPAWSGTHRTIRADLLQRLERVPESAKSAPPESDAPAATPARALDALMRLGQGRPAAEVAAQLRVPLSFVQRLENLSSQLHERLGSSPHRANRSARVADGGLMSRVPVTTFQRLRKGLTSISPRVLDARSAPGLADTHLIGMVGPSREVSMWTRAQMICVGLLVRSGVNDKSRLALAAASKVTPALLRVAADTGWLGSTGYVGVDLTSAPLCTRVDEKRLPAAAVIAPLDTRISNRLVFELTAAKDGWIHDRIELWISLACMHSCTEAAPSSCLFDADL